MTRLWRLGALAVLSACVGTDADAAKEGEMCAGIRGVACDTGLVCEIPAGQCAGRDMSGTCVPRPEMCTADFRPVCDCAGKQHSNDCERLKIGAQKDHDGECRKPK